MKKIFLLSVSFIALALNTFAYDAIGHRTAADIAYNNLTPAAKQQVDNLLGVRGLVYFSTWADDLRNDTTYSYSYNWHFQDLPDSMTVKDLQYLWDNPASQGKHLFYAIKMMTARLKTNKKDVEALKYIVHFIADLHQPFHLGRAEDRGGNDIPTKWFGQNIRVHQLWDSNLIEFQKYSYSEYSQYLRDKYSSTKDFYRAQTLFQSIQAAYELRQEVYKYNYGNLKPYTYNYMYKDKLDEMLYRAGIQLAKILNENY